MANEILKEYLEEDTQRNRFLTFILGSEAYGIEIRYVTEIISIQAISEVPEFPKYMRGIINLRGKIIPVMDVRLRFNKIFREYNDRTCIIVICINNLNVGLIVDSVAEVISIQDQEIEVPPEFKKGFNRGYIKGIGKVGKEVKLLLDCSCLIGEKEVQDLAKIS